MARYLWDTRLYNIAGVGVTANYSGYSDKGITNRVWHGTDRTIGYNLNGIDEAGFTLYLDDPMAEKIEPLESVIKIWRRIEEDDGTLIYEDDAETPSFGGFVSSCVKDGASNTMQVKVFSPLWRLQSRFHLLNHYLNINPDTTFEYTQSELMWKLIDLVNNAFGSESFTGITEGTFSWVSDPIVAPYFVAKGSNTWSNIFDDLMSRAGSPDILPDYTHTDGQPDIMYFHTDEKRGIDRSGSVPFNYHTGSSDNLSNLSEEVIANPGEFANYVWAVGQGGPNAGLVKLAENNAGTGYGYNAIGIYMRKEDYQDIKKLAPLQDLADATLARSKIPRIIYQVELSPAASIYYGYDYSLGDAIMLNADKGALSVTNRKQRIYQALLSNSDLNVETVQAQIANDFTGKVVPA